MSSRSDANPPGRRLRTVLVCHAGSRLNREAVGRWLASFTDLVGMVIIEERGTQAWNRVRYEVKRIGLLRLLDVLAFRLYYALVLNGRDSRWTRQQLEAIGRRYPPVPSTAQVFHTTDPNTDAVRAFLSSVAPDLMIARCKRILSEQIFTIPPIGTFVLHPGICPEYRNAHGAFWAMAEDDLEHVGLTLIKIDRGIDTGPVYGYFHCTLDELNESHIVLMTRLLVDNFDRIRDRLLEIAAGTAMRIDTTGRRSAVWGQPWLTKYLHWKRAARRRRDAGVVARVS